MKENINIAIIGATGMVGSKLIEIINEKKDIYQNIYLFASKRSKGTKIEILNKKYEVLELTDGIFNFRIDIAYFVAGGEISKRYALKLASKGVYVIDNSSYFRNEPNIPLIIPEVNLNTLNKNNYLISNPNCSTIQSVLTLKVIDQLYDIVRVNYTTYQAVSGSGYQGIKELINSKKGLEPKFYPKTIYDNLIPQIDDFLDDGFTKEEHKMINETQKILGKEIDCMATCVRVPINYGHSVSIDVETNQEIDLKTLSNAYKNFPGIKFYENDYPTPKDSVGNDLVLVGRLRLNPNNKKELLVWNVSDNVRKGAAANAYKIGEYIKGEYL
ncbi:MAG: aspartate-semialdehyde dehydrogenase [Acholeplasmataceae bacterium]